MESNNPGQNRTTTNTKAKMKWRRTNLPESDNNIIPENNNNLVEEANKDDDDDHGGHDDDEGGMTLRNRKRKPPELQCQSATSKHKRISPPSSSTHTIVSICYKDKDLAQLQRIPDIELVKVLPIDQNHSNLSMTYHFSNLMALDLFLERQLTIHGDKFKNIKTLKLLPKPQNVLVLIQEAQLELIMKLPKCILGNLSCLELGFGFHEHSINVDSITVLFGRCMNLSTFKIQHGIYGNGNKEEFIISIQIPQMKKLKKFSWMGPKAYTINSSSTTSSSIGNPIMFEIYFSGNSYPKLEEISLGYCTRVKFLDSAAQFPKLTTNLAGLIETVAPVVKFLWSPYIKAEVVENDDEPSQGNVSSLNVAGIGSSVYEENDNSNEQLMVVVKKELPSATVLPFPSELESTTHEESSSSASLIPSCPSSTRSQFSITYQNKTSGIVCNELKVDFLQLIEIVKNKNNTQLKIAFEFSNLVELDSFLQELEIYSHKLKQVEKLELKGSAVHEQVYIQQSQLSSIESLRAEFLCQLKSINFGFGLHDEVNSDIMTSLLSKCSALQFFTVYGGVFGTSCKPTKSIEIPELPNILVFQWLSSIKKSSAASELNEFPLEVNFSNHHFPNLWKINAGKYTLLKFEDLVQFPKLTHLITLNAWIKFDIFTCDPMLSVTSVDFPCLKPDPTAVIQQLPITFPNLQTLFLHRPSVASLRTAINVLSQTNLKELSISIDYDFESGLTTAFLNLPYSLSSSLSDQFKLRELKRYEHWSDFSENMGIEIPDDKHEDSTPALHFQRQSLGSFKSLESLNIIRSNRNIYLPLDNRTHWKELQGQEREDASTTTTKWSKGITSFPFKVLFDEFGKLKNTLKQFTVERMDICHEDIVKFNQIMGFPPMIEKWPGSRINENGVFE